VANYLYNPCAPCCLICGWGPYQFVSAADDPFSNQFQETDFSGSPTWSITANRLTLANGSGTLWKSSPNPDPTGKAKTGHLWTSGAATIQAVCWKSVSSLQSGVFIGGGRVFYADWSLGQFFHAPCDSTGHVTGALAQVVGTPADGNTLTICVQRMPSGSFNIAYSINGNVTATETGVALSGLTSGATFNSGFWGSQAAQFGQSSVVCGTSCPTMSSCNVCPSGLAPCWGLNVDGISASQFNGNFCLRAAGCTLTDQNSLWTVTIGANSSTLTAATGSSVLATYTQSGSFNCIGPNSFTFVSATSDTGWPTTINIGPTNCAAPPCVPVTTCGQCSWPTHWTITVSGVSDLDCQAAANLQVGAPTPPGWPDNPCWHEGSNMANALLPGCETINGTFMLSSVTGGGGEAPNGCGSGVAWTTGLTALNFCNNAIGALGPVTPSLPRIDLICCSSVLTDAEQFFEKWSLPAAPGMYLLIWQPTANAFYGSFQAGGGPPYQYACEAASFPVPYFCPFSQIECLQPITLTQISYVLPFPGLPPTFPISCTGFPGTVTVTPA
jgi:hypothetical protein